MEETATALASSDRHLPPAVEPHPRPRRGSRPPAWAIYLGIAVGLITIYSQLSSSLMHSLVYDLFELMCLAAIVIGIRINKPAERLPWYLLASGVGLWLMGNLIWTYFTHVAKEVPFPSIADALIVGGYPLSAAGIYLMVRRRGPKRDHSLLIDALIVTISAGVLAWIFLLAPYAGDQSLSMLEKLVSMANPLGDLLILSVLAHALLGSRMRSTALLLLAGGLILSMVSDSAYGLMLLEGTYFPGHIVDYGWLLLYSFWGLAALHPSMTARSRPAGMRRQATTRWRIALMTVVALAFPLLAIYERANGHASSLTVVRGASVVIFLLIILRMAGLLTRLESAHANMRQLEREKAKLLDRTLDVGEKERMRVAAELHDGPIHHLSALAYRFEAALLRLERGEERSAADALARVRDSLGQEIETLQEMMRGLRAPEVGDHGLKGALQDQLSAFRESSRILATLEVVGENRLPRELETAFFRVTQQALANVAKHSAARSVHLDLRFGKGVSQLTIEDDGVGFDASHVPDNPTDGQLGLIAMRQHVEALGGRFAVVSSSTGTVITARFGARSEHGSPRDLRLAGSS